MKIAVNTASATSARAVSPDNAPPMAVAMRSPARSTHAT
ncbi:Uncharacterised protein [Mycobacteroides abscessus subsp. abscessus]|nr:Uncharacterised protein [Mycobacteroides abscessus subsp. abscessus]